jgi:hypothetical protein
MVRHLLYIFAILSLPILGYSQEEEALRAALLIERCAHEPTAIMMVLKDEGNLSVNNDYTFKLDRKVQIRFFKDTKPDLRLAHFLFYPSNTWDKYYRLSVTTTEMDPSNKTLVTREKTTNVTNVKMENTGIRLKAGSLLTVSYSINLPYDEKIPDWRFQATIPVEYSSISMEIPEVVKLNHTLLSTIEPESKKSKKSTKTIRLDNQNKTLKVQEIYYQLGPLPSLQPEPFSDMSPEQLSRLHMVVESVEKGGIERTDFAEKQASKLIEVLSTKPDFAGRLFADFKLNSEYDRLIKSIRDPDTKVARIFDLVKRQIDWYGKDTIAALRPLMKIWNDRIGNSTEINLVLIKLLQMYGLDASPLLVSTRSNGAVDSNNFAMSDFNRTVAFVRLGKGHRIVDATARYTDYPYMPNEILNTIGLLVSMDKSRWITIQDTLGTYRNKTTLLGNMIGDSVVKTNAFISSYGYAKAERVEKLMRDSLKGLKTEFFTKRYPELRINHFIVANEYVDTLPLSQEFDLKIPLVKNDNLYAINPMWIAVPDTLLSLRETRTTAINFGCKQEYALISQFTFPSYYEVFVMPNSFEISSIDGSMHLSRQFHKSNTNFSLRQTLTIDKSYYSAEEAPEVIRFMRKIAAMQKQQVMLKKNN